MSYIQPLLTILLSIGILYSIRSWRSKASHARVLPVIIWLLFLLCWPPFAWLVARPLEGFSPPHDIPAGPGDAIVVLSSTVYPPAPPTPTGRLGNDTFERCQYAAWLYRQWRQVPVLASGGGASASSGEQPPYSITMREGLIRQGVPESAILVETKSRSTYENALYSAEILREKGIRRIVLVTDAYHMLRAEKCFEKQGIEVTPAACGYRTFQDLRWVNFLPSWEAVAWNEDVLHECVGLLWYRIRDRI